MLQSLSKTKQWRKNFSPPKTTQILVRKSDLPKKFTHAMLKDQITQVWVARYKKTWSRRSSSHPQYCYKDTFGGSWNRGGAIDPNWQERWMVLSLALSFMDKKGEKVDSSRRRTRSSEGVRDNTDLLLLINSYFCVLIANVLNSMYFGFYFG